MDFDASRRLQKRINVAAREREKRTRCHYGRADQVVDKSGFRFNWGIRCGTREVYVEPIDHDIPALVEALVFRASRPFTTQEERDAAYERLLALQAQTTIFANRPWRLTRDILNAFWDMQPYPLDYLVTELGQSVDATYDAFMAAKYVDLTTVARLPRLPIWFTRPQLHRYAKELGLRSS